MQNLLRIGTGLAVVLAIVSVILWRDLRAERELTTGLQAQVAEYASRDSRLMPQRIDPRPDATAAAAKNGEGTEPPATEARTSRRECPGCPEFHAPGKESDE